MGQVRHVGTLEELLGDAYEGFGTGRHLAPRYDETLDDVVHAVLSRAPSAEHWLDEA